MGKSKKWAKIDRYNRIVIPREIRKVLGLRKGDEVIFIVEEGRVQMTSRAALVKKLSGIFARDDGRNLTRELLRERYQEAERKRW